MKVNEKLVERIGSAMKLKFSEEDIKQFVLETEDTLKMLEKLGELDTEGVKGTFHGGVAHTARLREDIAVQDEEEVQALLENAPSRSEQLIEVPAILDDGEGGA